MELALLVVGLILLFNAPRIIDLIWSIGNEKEAQDISG